MTTGLFGIARSALLAHQTALQTVSQNVANAETPGYSRQEAVLQQTTPVRFPFGSVGTGVRVETIIRKRDILLDESFRNANTMLGDTGMRRDLLGQLEGIFGEPSDAGMANALDQFWNSWSDLSSAPSSLAARAVVQQRGRQLGQLFNDYDTSLTQQRMTTLERLDASVSRVNALAGQVAELNERIVSSESGGQSANDLRDMRDVKLDELSKLAGTRVINQPNGSVSVLIGNSTLVEGETANPLRLDLQPIVPTPAVPVTDVPARIRLGDSPDRLAPLAGELNALMQYVNTDVPQIRGRLDALAAGIVDAVNTVHTTGYRFPGGTIPGTLAGNFFTAGTVTNPVRAANISLDPDVANDPARIAASEQASGPTDNAIAVKMSQLRATDPSVTWTAPGGATESGSFVSFFRGMVTRLGIQVSSSTDGAAVAEGLVEQADLRRQSVSGVNTDEELVNMLRVQQSYQAATKMIKAAEEMLDTLLSLV